MFPVFASIGNGNQRFVQTDLKGLPVCVIIESTYDSIEGDFGMKKWIQVLFVYAGIPLAGVIGWLTLIFTESFLQGWGLVVIVPLVTVLMYFLLRDVFDLFFAAKVNACILIVLSIVLAIVLHISTGSTNHPAFFAFRILTFPFLIPSVALQLFDAVYIVLAGIFATYTVGLAACLVLSRMTGELDSVSQSLPRKLLPLLITAAVVLLCGAISAKQYFNRPEVRYAGHGFDYMHGYSSTDFTDYTVYSQNSKLVRLDHEPDLSIIGEKNMPVMDGAEACYPLYAAVAKAVYRDIDRIESEAAKTDAQYVNGKIVTFTNTVIGFSRLLDREVDLLFGARPSKSQFDTAKSREIELTVTPIGREAFVFFVENDNPVDNLTSEQIRAIYHGEIKNWKEVGGKNQAIKAFQRPKDSGSQSMMEYFMSDVSLMEPDTFEVIGDMLGVIDKVAQYTNEDGAMGYSFRYFVEELNQEKNVKLLSVDGVAPTLENIENGSYPLTVDLCLTTRANDPNPYVQKMIDFMLSKDGQEIVRRTGYAGLCSED